MWMQTCKSIMKCMPSCLFNSISWASFAPKSYNVPTYHTNCERNFMVSLMWQDIIGCFNITNHIFITQLILLVLNLDSKIDIVWFPFEHEIDLFTYPFYAPNIYIKNKDFIVRMHRMILLRTECEDMDVGGSILNGPC
jgi:hypothetical protein